MADGIGRVLVDENGNIIKSNKEGEEYALVVRDEELLSCMQSILEELKLIRLQLTVMLDEEVCSCDTEDM